MAHNGYDRLTPEGRRFYEQVRELISKQVFIGYQAGEIHTDADGNHPIDMAELAALNEYGHTDPVTGVMTPPRPFLRQSVDNHQAELEGFASVQAGRLLHGGTAEEILRSMGVKAVGMVQNEIRTGDFAPNAPSTIRNKGSDKPLIDTGAMRQSVHYIIRNRGGD